jgi:gustatory receptor
LQPKAICISFAQAHAPYEVLHEVNLEGAVPETSLQVVIFLNKLSGSSIGLTALKMFVIDKPTMLAVWTIVILNCNVQNCLS